MLDPYAEQMQRLLEAVLTGPGTLDPSVRQAAAAGRGVPVALTSLVEKVRTDPSTVTDEDMDDLLSADYSQDQIFEATISASLGAGLRCLKAALAAIEQSRVIECD